MSGIFAVRITALALAMCAAAGAQSLVDPGQIAATRERFAAAEGAARLRCTFSPIPAAVGYDLEFHTGYRVTFPLSQVVGTGHEITVLLQVAPDGRDPVYLAKGGALPRVPDTKADGEITGSFLVGEGGYSVDALVYDDAGRVCNGKWRIQAKAVGGERDLKLAAAPASVREVSAQPTADTAPQRGGARVERLTILLHAAPMRPRAAKLEPGTETMFVDSLASILSQVPAWRVRLVIFNQSQQTVLLEKDDFTAADLPRVTEAIEQMELARVDVRTLQKRNELDVLSDLIDKETRLAKPAAAVILMAPRSAAHADPAFQLDPQRMGASHWFYLAYQPMIPLMGGGRDGRGRGWGVGSDDGTVDMSRRGRVQGDLGNVPSPPSRSGGLDAMESLFRHFKGETLPVGSPHEFAEALRRMRGEVPMVKEPAAPATKPSAPTPTPTPAPAPTPATESKPATAEATEPDGAEGGGGQENPIEVLMRLRDQVLEHARKVPNHTCVETVERQRFEPTAGRAQKSCSAFLEARARAAHSLQLHSTDWLRLDVGEANRREIFSWAGAARFEERELDDIVPEGAIGTGLFAAMLLGLFENHDPHFRFDGEEKKDGRQLFAYSFSVPQAESYYRVKTRQKDWIVTGYAGRLLVDPKTAELARLNVRTDELPDSTSSCEIDTELDYGMVPLAGFDYLLPESTRQRFIGREGDEAENRASFAACREYRGESTLTFGGRPEAAGETTRNRAAALLPAGKTMTIELTKPIPFQGSAAGDRIEGRLAAPLGSVQRGAKVEGRLMRVEALASGQYSIALRWETLELDGVRVPLALKPNRAIPDVKRAPQGTLQRRGVPIELPRTGEELYAVYPLAGKDSRLEAGLRTEWVTIEP